MVLSANPRGHVHCISPSLASPRKRKGVPLRSETNAQKGQRLCRLRVLKKALPRSLSSVTESPLVAGHLLFFLFEPFTTGCACFPFINKCDLFFFQSFLKVRKTSLHSHGQRASDESPFFFSYGKIFSSQQDHSSANHLMKCSFLPSPKKSSIRRHYWIAVRTVSRRPRCPKEYVRLENYAFSLHCS